MANLRTNNLSGEQGQRAIKGSVVFGSDLNPAGLKIADNSDLELSSETNWTIEFWLFLNGATHGDYDVILGKGSATSNNYEYFVEVMSDNTLDFFSTSTGSAWTFQEQISPVLSADSWHHVAVVRNGSGSNSLKSYINGQEYGSFTAQSIHTSAYPFGVGYFAGGDELFADVTVSNLRIVKGTSVYTENFTPPFHELTAIPNTVLLCCQDSDNPFQEETGKTITGKGRYEYLNDDEVVLNGTFDSDLTSWTTQGDTVEIDNQRLKIIRSGSFGAATQQIGTRLTSNTQYKIRGRIEQSGSPGSALIRLSQYANGNGTIFFNGAYGTGTHEAVFTTNSSPTNFYVSAICGNGNVTGIFDDISVKAHDVGLPPKNIPPYGVDAGNTFGGSIKQSSEGYMYFPTGRTEERGRGRGIIVGGYNGPSSFGISGVLSAVEIASDGVASKFGDLSETRYTVATVGSSTRSVFIGGAMPVSPNPFYSVNTIDFVTIATTGNAQDFGDSDEVGYNKTGVSSSTRGVYTQGRIYNPSAGTGSNALEFITIATTGNGQDFGDLVGGGRATLCNAAMSSTRGILAGGLLSPIPPPSTNFNNIIEVVTMATLGNSVNFGDLQKSGGRSNGNCSSSTRGVFNIGTQSPADGNTLEFVTIATTGDAIDFGDLSGGQQMRGACSNQIRGLFAGGFVAPGSSNYVNTCERITIATTGSAADWGDPFETATGRAYNSGISDSHGGLS